MKDFLNKLRTNQTWNSLCVLGLWAVSVCFLLFLKQAPLRDEIHAWLIAVNSPLWQLFALARWEGHFFLWYLLVRCVSKVGAFPYALYALNFICCFAGICLIWRKAPFSSIIKAIVIFSFPLFVMYPTYARPYGLAFLLLAGLAVCYPVRLKHPWGFATLLFFCGHTHLLGLIGAVAFGMLFAIDLFRSFVSKQIASNDFWGTVGICFLTGICLVLEGVGFQRPAYSLPGGFLHQFQILAPFLKAEVLIYIVGVCFLIKSTKATFFGLFTLACFLSVHFFVYSLWFWQQPFLFIYLVFAFWIYCQDYPVKKPKIPFFLLFAGAAFLYYFSPSSDWPINYKDPFKDIVRIEGPFLQNAKIFSFGTGLGETLGLYLDPPNLHTWNLETGLEDFSYENLKLLFSGRVGIRYDKIAPLLEKDKPNIAILHIYQEPIFFEEQAGQPYQLQLEKYVCYNSYLGHCLYFLKKDPGDKNPGADGLSVTD